MIPTLAGGGVILGGIIDYGTGAIYDLQPNPLTITLACEKVAVAEPSIAAPEPESIKPLLINKLIEN